MRYRVLAILPFAFTAVLIVGCLLLGDGPARRPFMRVEIETAKALALIGCMAAAFRFVRADYLRWAWFLSGSSYGLILLRDALVTSGYLERGRGVDYLEGGVILLANTSSVVGTWLLARAWQVAGMELPGSRRGRGTVIVAAIVIAIAIAGPAVYVDFNDLLAGRRVSLVGVASDLGDIISFCLIAPVMLTAIALRGGSLVWPWGLITASMLGWLCYDGTLLVGNRLLHADALLVRTVSDTFRTLACLFGFSAGIAQRFAVAPRAPVSASVPGADR